MSRSEFSTVSSRNVPRYPFMIAIGWHHAVNFVEACLASHLEPTLAKAPVSHHEAVGHADWLGRMQISSNSSVIKRQRQLLETPGLTLPQSLIEQERIAIPCPQEALTHSADWIWILGNRNVLKTPKCLRAAGFPFLKEVAMCTT